MKIDSKNFTINTTVKDEIDSKNHIPMVAAGEENEGIEESPGGIKYYVPAVDESLVPKVAMMFDSSSWSPPRPGFDCAAGRSSMLFASSSGATPPMSPGAFGS
ncbi:hypothetical protein L6452_05495 [Arctium lappa]|uniref:Uncharacterized protein n=1 Tax=Arctium lappa TaxID=4217 RepID=A0ACB9EGR8_ARCLA|nr:hypothetical protein L6452_05495 [Arctium lappa]